MHAQKLSNSMIRAAAYLSAFTAGIGQMQVTSAADAAPGVIAAKLTREAFVAADAPAYLKNAVKLTLPPEKPSSSFDEHQIQFTKPGALFLTVKQVAPVTKPNWIELSNDKELWYFRWTPIGECPWNKEANLWIRPVLDPRTVVVNLPTNLKFTKFSVDFEVEAELELLAVDHETYAEEAHAKTLGSMFARDYVRCQAEAMFRQKRWQDLEALFAKARQEKLRFPDGHSSLEMLYAGVLHAPAIKNNEFDDLVDAYREAVPNSAVTRLIMLGNVADRVWGQRGGGSGGAVSDDASKALKEMSVRTKPLVQEALAAAANDPMADRTQVRIISGGSPKPAEIQKVILSGLKKDPWDYGILNTSATYLLPRWFGEAKTLSTFAGQLQKDFADSSGPALYACAALAIFPQEPDEWETGRGFDYQRVIAGVNAFREKFPENTEVMARAICLAAQHGDLKTAQAWYEPLVDRFTLKDWEDFGEWPEWHDYLNPPTETAIAWQAPISMKGWNRLQFNESGKKLFVAPPLGKLREFDAATGKLLSSVSIGFLEPFGVAAVDQDTAIVLTTRKSLQFKNGKTTKSVPFKPALSIMAGAVSADGRYAAAIDERFRSVMYDTKTNKLLGTAVQVVKPGPEVMMKVCLSSDGKRAAFAGQEVNVSVFNTVTGKPHRQLTNGNVIVEAIAFNSAGKKLIATGRKPREKFDANLPLFQGVMWEWDVDTGEVLWTVDIPTFQGRVLAVSADGERIAVAMDYATEEFPYETKLWITDSKQAVDANAFVREQRQKIADMKWSPDSEHLAVLGNGGFVRVYKFGQPKQ